MANWKYTLNISTIWNNKEMAIEDKGKLIANKMRQVFPNDWFDFGSESYDQDLDEIAEALENITGYDNVPVVEEFDDWMEQLYDWADQEIPPFEQYPRNVMCWIETVDSGISDGIY